MLRAPWVLLLPALAAALNPLGLPESRPAGCDPTTCTGCGPYLPPGVTEISDQNAVPEKLCGTDVRYFPVSVQYGCSADDLYYPVRWLCQACCTAGCAGSSFDYYCATYDYQVGCGGPGLRALPPACLPRTASAPGRCCQAGFDSASALGRRLPRPLTHPHYPHSPSLTQAEETVGCGGCPAGLDLGRVPVDVLGFGANCTRPHWDQNFYQGRIIYNASARPSL